MIKFKEFLNFDELRRSTAKQLQQGKIIGWFQGRSEFGPRALGNRSIVTAPFPAEMKDTLNKKVKFREWFRPYAPAVMEEHVEEYFDLPRLRNGKFPESSYYMLFSAKTRSEKINEIPAVTHVDRSARLQVVSRESNERFYLLIDAFKEFTGIPVILNTSFNVAGDPIVETPQDAFDTFKKTNVDILVMGDFFVWKEESQLSLL